MNTVTWKPIGQVTKGGGVNDLVFPSASTARGAYWFAVAKGPEVVAGYVGKAAGKNGLDQRFRNYENRGKHPRDQRGRSVPPTARDDQLGTTSLNARRILRALDAGQTVSVSVIDDPALADEAVLNGLEIDLIGQLCASGVVVWNVRHVASGRSR